MDTNLFFDLMIRLFSSLAAVREHFVFIRG